MSQQAIRAKFNSLVLIIFATIGLVLTITGCTSKQLYNAVQENRLQECRKLYGPQREECEARYQKDFETYQREREEVISSGNK